MSGPSDRKPPVRTRPRRDDTTIRDNVLTEVLNSRVKREVALERATEAVETDGGAEDAPVVVVLGPDGVPQIADEVERAPETIRIDLDEPTTSAASPQAKSSPPARKGPPPLPPRKR